MIYHTLKLTESPSSKIIGRDGATMSGSIAVLSARKLGYGVSGWLRCRGQYVQFKQKNPPT